MGVSGGVPGGAVSGVFPLGGLTKVAFERI